VRFRLNRGKTRQPIVVRAGEPLRDLLSRTKPAGPRILTAHSSDGDQWFQMIVITVSSDRDQAQHELFTVLSIGAAANTTDGLM
jgi:hypothetical protein